MMDLSSSAAGPTPAGRRRCRPPLPARLTAPFLCPPACSGLPTNVTEDAVAQFFGTIGMIKMDKKTKRPKVGAAPAGSSLLRIARVAVLLRSARLRG